MFCLWLPSRQMPYQVLDDISIETSDNNRQVRSQDQEGGMQDQDKSLLAVQTRDQDLEDGLNLSKELLVHANLDRGLYRGGR